MNANELADYIDSGNDMWKSDRELLVDALRLKAALEWLWAQRPANDATWLVFPSSGGFRARSGSRTGDGSTPTEAINNLRAKLDPPHEHVWDDAGWDRVYPDKGTGFVRCCLNRPCPTDELQHAERLVAAP